MRLAIGLQSICRHNHPHDEAVVMQHPNSYHDGLPMNELTKNTLPRLTIPHLSSETNGEVAEIFNAGNTQYWREVMGSFNVQIPVVPHQDLLPEEYDNLAIMKWYLSQMQPTDRR